MDEVDQQQQQEIEELKRKDVAHDTSLDWMTFALKFASFTFVVWVIISSAIIFILIDKLDKLVK